MASGVYIPPVDGTALWVYSLYTPRTVAMG